MIENNKEKDRLWDWLFFWNMFKKPAIVPLEIVYNEQQQEVVQEPTETGDMHDEECCQTRNEPCGCYTVKPTE